MHYGVILKEYFEMEMIMDTTSLKCNCAKSSFRSSKFWNVLQLSSSTWLIPFVLSKLM